MKKRETRREYVAYQGREFTIEWYYDARGRSSALEYAETLDELHQRKLLGLFQLLGDIGQVRNQLKFRNEGDQIYAFKPKPHRFLCFFFQGGKVIVTNGFYKDQDHLPPNEKSAHCSSSTIMRRALKQVPIMPKSEKPLSTYSRWMRKPGFKRAFERDYKDLLLSELVLAIMAEDKKSVRQLADELGVSKTVVQNLRSGTQTDMKLSNFIKLAQAYGYHVVLEKEGSRIGI